MKKITVAEFLYQFPRKDNTNGTRKVVLMLLTIALVFCLTAQGKAQVSTETIANSQSSASSAATSSAISREALLIDRIEKLERRLAELEAKLNTRTSTSINTAASTSTAEIEATPLPQEAETERSEYLAEKISPSGGLFSGVTQALKEGTFTAEYKLADGFLLRGEYRRDWSNQPFFLTEQPGVLKKEQNTATLGLVWWLGRKQGTW